jgi:hypothetical protein
MQPFDIQFADSSPITELSEADRSNLETLVQMALLLLQWNEDLFLPIASKYFGGLEWERQSNLGVQPRFGEEAWELAVAGTIPVLIAGVDTTTSKGARPCGTTEFEGATYTPSYANGTLWEDHKSSLANSEMVGICLSNPSIADVVQLGLNALRFDFSSPPQYSTIGLSSGSGLLEGLEAVAAIRSSQHRLWSTTKDQVVGHLACSLIQLTTLIYHEVHHLVGFRHDFEELPEEAVQTLCIDNTFAYFLYQRIEEETGSVCSCIHVGNESVLIDNNEMLQTAYSDARGETDSEAFVGKTEETLYQPC